MRIFLSEAAYMVGCFVWYCAIPLCILSAIYEWTYCRRFAKAFRIKMSEMSNYVRPRMTRPGEGQGNTYKVEKCGDGRKAMYACTMYVNGWRVTSRYPDAILDTIRLLEERDGITCSKGEGSLGLEESAAGAPKRRTGVVERPLKALFFILLAWCCASALSMLAMTIATAI